MDDKHKILIGVIILIAAVSGYMLINKPSGEDIKCLECEVCKNVTCPECPSCPEPVECPVCENVTCPECPEAECPKPAGNVTVTTEVRGYGNAKFDSGEVEFTAGSEMKTSGVNSTFMWNTSQSEEAMLLFDLNYSCSLCPKCKSRSCNCPVCTECPEPKPCETEPEIVLYLNETPLNEVREEEFYHGNDTTKWIWASGSPNYYPPLHEQEIVSVKFEFDKEIYSISEPCRLYKFVDGSWVKVNHTNVSEQQLGCFPVTDLNFTWNQTGCVGNATLETITDGRYLLEFCYKENCSDFEEKCIYKKFEIITIPDLIWLPTCCFGPYKRFFINATEVKRVTVYGHNFTTNYISASPDQIIEIWVDDEKYHFEVDYVNGNVTGVGNFSEFTPAVVSPGGDCSGWDCGIRFKTWNLTEINSSIEVHIAPSEVPLSWNSTQLSVSLYRA